MARSFPYRGVSVRGFSVQGGVSVQGEGVSVQGVCQGGLCPSVVSPDGSLGVSVWGVSVQRMDRCQGDPLYHVNRTTDRCKSITLSKTSFADGNNHRDIRATAQKERCRLYWGTHCQCKEIKYSSHA